MSAVGVKYISPIFLIIGLMGMLLALLAVHDFMRAPCPPARAWLVASVPGRFGLDPTGMDVDVRISNSGQVPALDAVAATGFAFLRRDLPTLPTMLPGSVVVGPGEEHALHVRVAVRISKEQVAAVMAGGLNLYVGGAILYADPAGKGRSTDWCALYKPASSDFIVCPEPGSTVLK